jgi:site-specific DNA recombinase
MKSSGRYGSPTWTPARTPQYGSCCNGHATTARNTPSLSRPRRAAAVPLAFVGRTSTTDLQDPVASLRRQLRESRDKLLPGMYIAAYFWDIESGGLDIEDRSQTSSWEQFDVGIPGDGGLAELLAEARSPAPRFAAVICENIERSGRDTYNALKLERELSGQGIPLFATDEPISMEGMNSTAVLVRRVKQGVAEWYRLQVKEAAWKGLREHAMDGWNIGRPPYGYAAERHPHPVPFQAAQGRTRTRLILDPGRAPVIGQIFTWRTIRHLGITTITNMLNADTAAYPPPDPAGWTTTGVRKILGNPKYTGNMVSGRRRKHGRHHQLTDPADWMWSAEPAHPAIVTRATWDAAQEEAARHSTSRDTNPADDASAPGDAAGRRAYELRSRVFCRECRRRMYGTTRRPRTPAELIYYACPHNPANPRHAAACPDHPAAILVREDHLLAAVRQFADERLFGPDRAALLADAYPHTARAAAAARTRETTRLNQRLARIDTAQNAQADQLAALAESGADPRAVTALRDRTLARLTELQDQRAAVTTRLDALTVPDPETPGDPALLDELPYLAGLLNRAPARLRAQLYAALDLRALYNKDDDQATIRAAITTSTPDAIRALISDSIPGTSVSDLAPLPRR